jgi:DNA invertase Pin-like site-specific DNA recombinase
MLGAISQFETEIRAERQMDGIRKAKERDVAFGRQRSLSAQEVDALREKRSGGALIKDLMREYGLSKATIYRYLQTEAA